jgi:hypothetical protein
MLSGLALSRLVLSEVEGLKDRKAIDVKGRK